MKICSRCKSEQPLDNFPKDSSRKDGHSYVCRSCSSARMRKWRKENPDKARAAYIRDHENNREARNKQSREWRKKNPLRVYENNSAWREKNPDYSKTWAHNFREKFAAYARAYAEAHPRRVEAKRLVRLAVLRGEIERGPCSVCGVRSNVEAHHEDYDMPLAVTWLCRNHHVERHNIIRKKSRQEAKP